MAEVSNNELCRCGSGKLYLECHAIRERSQEKVAFVIAGAQKSGTTAIFHYLRDHPQVCIPARKELHFFDSDRFFEGGRPDYAGYRALLSPTLSQRLLGDATPSYMYWEPAPERIWRYNPTMKFVIVLRNPVTRAFAHWNLFRQKGIEPLPFYEALLAEPERRRRTAPRQLKVQSYIDRGFYTEQLRRIEHLFSPSQMLILRSEELQTQAQRTVDRITDFLEIDRLRDVQPKRSHSTPYQETMSVQARDHLLHNYEFEVRQLERMLGWDCSDWIDPHGSLQSVYER